MANGYCPTILQHIEAMSGCNPSKKLRPLGFTKAVLSSTDDSVQAEINAGYEAGHTRPIAITYRERLLESSVSDTPSACDSAITPTKKEFNLPGLLYSEVSLYLSDAQIRQYCKDSSEMVKINAKGDAEMSNSTGVMREVYEMLVDGGNVLLSNINKKLVTQAATAFGKNLVTDSTAARELSFTLGDNGMRDAFVSLMADVRENEFCDDVIMVGNGDFANLDLIKGYYASAAADNGINKANLLAAFPDVFFDKDTRAIWGNNQIGVFEKGSLGLISYLKNTGSFARKWGNSEFFSMALPVQEYCCPQEYLDRLMFDVQIREIDCPTTMIINGQSVTAQPGVHIILSKNFSLWQRPGTLYNVADPLYGTNGALRYEITQPA